MAVANLCIVVPALNEERGIAEAIRTICVHAQETALHFEVIVIDDGSTDGTWAVLQSLASENSVLRAIRFSRNFGKEAAIAAGLDVAGGQAAIIMDADLQHPPDLIPIMVRLWQTEGWEVVEAVKTHRGRELFVHTVLTRAFYTAAWWLTGYELQDASDYKLLDRRVVDAWRKLGERATFFRGLVSWLGFRHTQVFFSVPARVQGQSQWSRRGLIALAIRAITSFSALPLQVVTALGFLTLLIAVLLGVQAVRLWYEGRALPGVTTVVLLQLILNGFLMLSLGIIGTYVARIYDEVKARPRYVVRETISPD
ncbi:MAG: glycosyltransferase family 2 protein [Vicinamibacterales bacterium]